MTLPQRPLGSTGEQVSIIGLGGWHLSLEHVDEPLAIRLVRRAVDHGITFMDNSWDYNDGASEVRMGKALRDGYRDKVFLMTKIDGRSKKEATRQLDESLQRLGTDHLDLVQHHEIIRYEDPHRIFAEDGANRPCSRRGKAGKLRFIGFTGHKDPHIHLHMLEVARANGFRFDTVQMPLNVMDAHYRSFAAAGSSRAGPRRDRGLGHEEPGQRHHPQVGAGDGGRVPPLRPQSADLGGDHRDATASRFWTRRWTRRGRSRRCRVTKRRRSSPGPPAARPCGRFEPFKTSSIFDSTATHPQWLGEEAGWAKALR